MVNINFFIFFFFLHFFKCEETKNNKKSFNETLLKWGKKKNIKFSNKIILNYTSNNFKTFYANDDISENEIILEIPYESTLTIDLLEKYSPKFLLDIYSDIKNNSSPSNKIFRTPMIKQQVFIALNLEYAISHKKKSKLYKLYKPYFQSFENNFDYYPLLYGEGELTLINPTNFGAKVINAKQSIFEEFEYIQKNYSYESLINDEYIKYRIMSVSKFYNFMGNYAIVPFFDFFPIEMNKTLYNVFWNVDNNTKKFIIKSNKNIKKGEKLIMKCLNIPNSRLLMYYGLTFEKNDYIDPFIVKYLHSKLKKEIKIQDYILNPKISEFDLSKESFIGDSMDNYRNLGSYFNLPNNDDTGYILMLKNLKYYLEDYNLIDETDYYKKIIFDKNRINIRRVIDLEKLLLQKRIDLLQEIVDDRMKGKKIDL